MGTNKNKTKKLMKLLIATAAMMVAAQAKFVFKGWKPHGKLSECQGDCDSNRECGAGLYCQHDHRGYVRGHNCGSRGRKYADYCVRRANSRSYTFYGWKPRGRLGTCQGDCDSNKECRRGLRCAHTNGYARGMGCRGRSHKKMADYCVGCVHIFRAEAHKAMVGYIRRLRKAHGAKAKHHIVSQMCRAGAHHAHKLRCRVASRWVSHWCRMTHRGIFNYHTHFHFIGWSPKRKLGECEGDCDHDRNCVRGSRCAQSNGYLRGHGCKGRSKTKYADYCVRRLPMLRFRGWSPKFRLSKCEGDCDSNKNCKGHMKCHHDKKRIHGCRGYNRIHLADYCA